MDGERRKGSATDGAGRTQQLHTGDRNPQKGDTAHVKAVFELLFRTYGLPRFIRSDNGPPFGNVFNQWGLSPLSVWFMNLRIKIDLDDPGCPYQNGGHERMHRDMKKELQGKINGNLRDHQKEFDKWRNDFNNVRPHEALGMKRPKEVYKNPCVHGTAKKRSRNITEK